MSQPLHPIPPHGPSGDRPRGETRKCDACGSVTFCVTLPLRDHQSGSLCVACLGRTLRGMQSDGR